MTLGKGYRKLSYFQSKEWMDKIAKKRKYKWDFPKGEKHPRVKITELFVKLVLSFPAPFTREMAKKVARIGGVCESYPYHLRARYRWKHL